MPRVSGSAAGSGTISAANSHTRSYTTTADADFLIVCVGSGKNAFGGLPAVSTVVWNSQNLTAIRRATNAKNCRAQIWGLQNPARSTTANCVVTMAGATTMSIAQIGYCVIRMDGSFTDRQPASGNSAAPSVAVSTARIDLVVDAMCGDTPTLASVGSGQTQLLRASGTGGTNSITIHASYEFGTGSSVTMDWSWAGSHQWATAAVSFQDYGLYTLPILGVGR